MAAVWTGVLLFISALALATLLEPSTVVLHVVQVAIYLAIAISSQRGSAWGAGAGITIGVLWNSANLFVTGFVRTGLIALAYFVRTFRIEHPACMLVVLGALAHFLILAGCLVVFLRSKPRSWARLFGGAVLMCLSLVAIYPLRHHERPLPLDVTPNHDAIGAATSGSGA